MTCPTAGELALREEARRDLHASLCATAAAQARAGQWDAYAGTLRRALRAVAGAEGISGAAGAAETIERLRAALRGLLSDTQHAEHRCGDEDCPVRVAREALR